MMRLIFVRLVTTFGLIFLLFSAYLSWQNDLLVVSLSKQKTVNVVREFDVNAFPILIVEPLKLLLAKASSQASVDNLMIIDLLRNYLTRRPFDAGAWLVASQFYQRVDEIGMASQALEVAYKLSENNTRTLLKVFNRYLELGLVDKALAVARDIVYTRPQEFRRLFYLMGRLSDDYSLLVRRMIPKNVPVARGSQKQRNSGFYFNWALADAIRTDNGPLAQAVWDVMPMKFKKHTRHGVRYINYLIEFQKPNLLESVWFDVVGEKMQAAELLDQDGLSPCWQVKENDSVDVVVDTSVGSVSLKLEFLGGENLNYSHLSCVVQVSPGTQYLLVGRTKGEGITTLSGPFIGVSYPGVEGFNIKSEAMIGTWGWADFQVLLDVPKGVHFAKIRVRRARTRFLDSKISGRVWFENIELEKL